MDKEKAFTASVDFIPSFNDTDPMGIVWHGTYLRFFEKAREVLFRSLHYGYKEMRESGYAYPVVDVHIKYRRPWLLEARATVKVTLTEYENRLVTEYEVIDAESNTLLTTARIVQMAFDLKTREGLLECPTVLFEKLGVAKP